MYIVKNNSSNRGRDTLLNEGIVEIGHIQYENQKGLIIRPAYKIEGEIYFFSRMKAVGNTIYSVQLRPFNQLKEAEYIPLEEKSCITV
ncbi:hypothetical protein [Bacillus thuringiensis]|uniref:hypothetical protein n=1 Tax=Bacillus thuringiensis TaxID=1428 RepID=UPI000BF71E35|nr:hypothetical protein CN322_20225 [Bacillus thuringiensis]PFJ50156.1 hypothetical protein COJ02_27100 [Bacillus thuringiensis]PFW26470.1 hypothetical protein COL19_06690 [Bacillus thuringiensis]